MYAVMYHTCTVYTNFGLELILKIYVLSARERDFIVILLVSKLNMGTCTAGLLRAYFFANQDFDKLSLRN